MHIFIRIGFFYPYPLAYQQYFFQLHLWDIAHRGMDLLPSKFFAGTKFSSAVVGIELGTPRMPVSSAYTTLQGCPHCRRSIFVSDRKGGEGEGVRGGLKRETSDKSGRFICSKKKKSWLWTRFDVAEDPVPFMILTRNLLLCDFWIFASSHERAKGSSLYLAVVSRG